MSHLRCWGSSGTSHIISHFFSIPVWSRAHSKKGAQQEQPPNTCATIHTSPPCRFLRKNRITRATLPAVSVHLKDGTSTDTATALLSSTRDKALGDDDGSTQIAITLKWSVEGTDINVFFLISASSHDIATNVQHDLSPVGEAKSIQRPGETSPLQIDYGDVTTPPSSLTTPSGSSTIKTFTMNGWHVTLDCWVFFGHCLFSCFRLPSLSSGARVRPRSGCGIPGLSEGGHDCISARSTRQYP